MGIDANSLIARLPLVDENILGEAAKQPILFVDAMRYRVAAMKRRAEAQAEFDYMRSRIALAIRAKRTELGEKVTEATLNARVEKHPKIREMRAAVERAFEAEEFAKLMLEAYRMRRDAIRVIAEAQIAEGMRGSHELERIQQGARIRKTARDLDERRRRSEIVDE